MSSGGKFSIVLASNNAHKLIEFRKILCGTNHKIRILSLRDVGFSNPIPETGSTFAENSLQKANTVLNALNVPVIADDSGVEVHALDGRPGVYSARFAGENATDEENNALLLKSLEGVPFKDRTARFVANISLVMPQKGIFQAEGECKGFIVEKAAGEHGFGYDPLFWLPKFGKTMAEIPPEEKNKISHRFMALKKINKILISLLN